MPGVSHTGWQLYHILADGAGRQGACALRTSWAGHEDVALARAHRHRAAPPDERTLLRQVLPPC
jgi:hypothetical protein